MLASHFCLYNTKNPFKLISKYLNFSRFFDTYNLPNICLETLKKELRFHKSIKKNPKKTKRNRLKKLFHF